MKAANVHLSKDEKEKTVEGLKLASIDLSVTAAMVAVTSSLKHVQHVEKLYSD